MDWLTDKARQWSVLGPIKSTIFKTWGGRRGDTRRVFTEVLVLVAGRQFTCKLQFWIDLSKRNSWKIFDSYVTHLYVYGFQYFLTSPVYIIFLTKQEVVYSMMCFVQLGRARIDSAKSDHPIFSQIVLYRFPLCSILQNKQQDIQTDFSQ